MITSVPADFITVAALRTHLKKSAADDDAELGIYASAACQMVINLVGHVSPVTAVFDGEPRCGTLVLPDRPVISVTSVLSMPGGETVAAADPMTGTPGWTLLSLDGVMSITGASLVRVQYVPGRDPIPANYTLAALELAGHLWRSSKLNQGGGRPAVGGSDDTLIPGTAYALPHRVRELLGLAQWPCDEPMVG